MALSSLTRLDAEHTPATTHTPTTSSDADGKSIEPLELASKACMSKNCIHKNSEKEKEDENKQRKGKKVESDSESSGSESDSSSSESDSDSSSDTESDRKRRKSKSKKDKKDKKDKKKQKSKSGRRRKAKKSSKSEKSEDDEGGKECATSITSVESKDVSNPKNIFKNKQFLKEFMKAIMKAASDKSSEDISDDDSAKSVKSEASSTSAASDKSEKKEKKDKKKKAAKVASKCEFKRLDEIWDDDTYDWKLKETVEDERSEKYEEYIFTVRRKFDDEGHHQKTVVYIKSSPLKECLDSVMNEVDSVSLVEETPHLDPNMLFLFLEEFRELVTELKDESKSAKKRRARKTAATKAKHLEVLVGYLDKDYDETKKRLNPLLQNGRITFDLLWALFKPNTLAYTSTYGDDEQPRAVKIVSSYVQKSFSKGTYYEIEGKYLDFDGKSYGSAETFSDVSAFQGTRKITSLSCYPLKYHQDVEKIKRKLVDRGKKFLTLAGMNYRLYKGMGYIKKEDKFLKVSVNGRIMIDPGTFRRINPNYPMNNVDPREIEDMDEDGECCCNKVENNKKKQAKDAQKLYRLVTEQDGPKVVEVDLAEQEDLEKHVDSAEKEQDLRNTFTEEELLTASAVLPGFSFSEKIWLEFAVSHVMDVTWNEGAFESLVLPEKHKTIVKALVSAHALHSSKGIDDIIAGKGKGLVAVLHGRPGLGKTLTCEAVSDLLRRPLYTVSAGDLGTNPTTLETELQAILDIAHTWGAVLLMDEADVFLEERSIHDVHRNALVSIFLRLLEYFQGILFLTTNRVETFDEAFVSRIHLSLRYGELTTKAKRAVWKTFIDKVAASEGNAVENFTEDDYQDLARQDMNGRQIKNLVKTAQALALHEGVPMGMTHIRRVIDVAKSFEIDLKGGRGFEQAMLSYT